MLTLSVPVQSPNPVKVNHYCTRCLRTTVHLDLEQEASMCTACNTMKEFIKTSILEPRFKF
jgi:hypothetical protein